MSRAFTHATFGLASYILVRTLTGYWSPILPVFYVLFSILPDFDMLFDIRHRSITHSLVFLAPFILASFAVFYVCGDVVWALLFLQPVFHVVFDVLQGGVRLFYPFSDVVVGTVMFYHYGSPRILRSTGIDERGLRRKTFHIDAGDAITILALLITAYIP